MLVQTNYFILCGLMFIIYYYPPRSGAERGCFFVFFSSGREVCLVFASGAAKGSKSAESEKMSYTRGLVVTWLKT